MLKLLSTTAVVLALSGPVWAAGESYPFLEMQEGAWGSDTLIGKELQTADGQPIGQVEGVIFTPDDRIAGVIVDAGQLAGVESRPVVVDWYAVNVVPDEQVLSVDMTKDQITAAPEMEEDQFVELWRDQKEAEVPDVAESQPGVVAGEDPEQMEDAPDAGAGTTGEGGDQGGTDSGGGTTQ